MTLGGGLPRMRQRAVGPVEVGFMGAPVMGHPQGLADWERLAEFARQVQPEADAEALVRWLRDRPGFANEDHAMLFEGSQLVATASLLSHRVYLGEGELSVGELSCVGVHPEHRMEGHARALIGHWLAVAERRDYALVTTAEALPRVLEPFGFAPAAPCPGLASLRIQAQNLVGVMSPWRVRPMMGGDAPAIMGLYDRAMSGTPLAEVRTPEAWTAAWKATGRGGFGWWVAVDTENRVHGFAWAEREEGRLREVVAADEEAALALLQWLRWELAEHQLGEATASVPLDGVFARTAMRSGAWACEPHAPVMGWGSTAVRVGKLTPCITALRGHFEAALANSRFARTELQATFWCEQEAVSLRWTGSVAKVGPGGVGRDLRLPRWAWAPLIMGHRTVDELPGLELDEAERAFLRVLFPQARPWPGALDHLTLR